jgi:glyoxylase I family protein
MPISCTYLHTNLTVKDIEKMKAFYENVFGCVSVREIQQLTGKWIEGITSVKDGEIKYVHLRFPGHGSNGPELELIEYVNPTKEYEITPNTLGFGHISFSVENVHEALKQVVQAGGGSVGDVVTVEVPKRGLLTEVYATDPEGNVIELQSYAK